MNFWSLAIVLKFLSPDILLFLSWVWTLSGIYMFNTSLRKKTLNNLEYYKTFYFVLLGVFFSMFSAFAYGGQSIITSLIAQRNIYSFMLLPVMLFVQPTEEDIIKALKWISIGTVIVWVLVHFDTNLIKLDKSSVEQVELQKQDLSKKLEFYVNGSYFVVLYCYVKMNEYIKSFSWKTFIEASLYLVFIILYQNRSLILGVIPIYAYSLFKFKSNDKVYIVIVLSILLTFAILISTDLWMSLFNKTKSNLNETDYNRWKSLTYYFHEYSPSYFCYVFGNGFPSGGNSPIGNLMWSNFTKGIFASDLGMIGMWVDYGLIPLFAIYSIIVRVIKHVYFPLYLKFICLHILFVPTIFHFWANPGITFFVIIIYFHAYYSEIYKNLVYEVSNSNSKL